MAICRQSRGRSSSGTRGAPEGAKKARLVRTRGNQRRPMDSVGQGGTLLFSQGACRLLLNTKAPSFLLNAPQSPATDIQAPFGSSSAA